MQTDKRNTYRNKVAANKASGKTDTEQPGEGDDVDIEGEGESLLDRDGQPAAKKARRDPDMSEDPAGHSTGGHDAEDGDEDDDQGDDPEDEDEEEQERLEVEEAEEREEREAEDEALDNGEDSD